MSVQYTYPFRSQFHTHGVSLPFLPQKNLFCLFFKYEKFCENEVRWKQCKQSANWLWLVAERVLPAELNAMRAEEDGRSERKLLWGLVRRWTLPPRTLVVKIGWRRRHSGRFQSLKAEASATSGQIANYSFLWLRGCPHKWCIIREYRYWTTTRNTCADQT